MLCGFILVKVLLRDSIENGFLNFNIKIQIINLTKFEIELNTAKKFIPIFN